MAKDIKYGQRHQRHQIVRNRGRNAVGLLHAHFPIWRRYLSRVSERNAGLRYTERVLGASQQRLETHALGAGGSTNLGITGNDQMDLRRAVPTYQRMSSRRTKQVLGGLPEESTVMMDVRHTVRDKYGGK